MFLSCSFSYAGTQEMHFKFKLIIISLLGSCFFMENLQGQSSHPSYKDTSQTITREELREEMDVNKKRKDKVRATKKKTREANRRTSEIRDSLANSNEKPKPALMKSRVKKRQ